MKGIVSLCLVWNQCRQLAKMNLVNCNYQNLDRQFASSKRRVKLWDQLFYTEHADWRNTSVFPKGTSNTENIYLADSTIFLKPLKIFFFFYFSVCHMKVKCYLQQSFYPLAGSLSLHQTAQGITDIFRIQLALVYLKNPYLTSSLLISKLVIPRSFPSQLFITDKESGHFWRRRKYRIC